MGDNSNFSNGIRVGTFSTLTTKISLTSGSSAVYVPVPAALPLMVGAIGALAGFGALRNRKKAA